MNRPIYESADDRENERNIISAIESKWLCKATKLKMSYMLDYALVRDGKVRAFAEVKKRKYSMAELDKFGGFFVSLDKWARASQLSKASGVPFFVVVEANGTIYYHQAEWHHDGVIIGGRTDRSDPDDVEPTVLLRSARFVELK